MRVVDCFQKPRIFWLNSCSVLFQALAFLLLNLGVSAIVVDLSSEILQPQKQKLFQCLLNCKNFCCSLNLRVFRYEISSTYGSGEHPFWGAAFFNIYIYNFYVSMFEGCFAASFRTQLCSTFPYESRFQYSPWFLWSFSWWTTLVVHRKMVRWSSSELSVGTAGGDCVAVKNHSWFWILVSKNVELEATLSISRFGHNRGRWLALHCELSSQIIPPVSALAKYCIYPVKH